jgi:hypothetical protein
MELLVSAADPQIFRQSVFTTSGWGRAEYSGWIDESQSRKTSIGDWSFLDQGLVRGPDALRLFSNFSVTALPDSQSWKPCTSSAATATARLAKVC